MKDNEDELYVNNEDAKAALDFLGPDWKAAARRSYLDPASGIRLVGPKDGSKQRWLDYEDQRLTEKLRARKTR